MNDGALVESGVRVFVAVNGVQIDLPESTLQAIRAALDEAAHRADQIEMDRIFWTEMCDRYAARQSALHHPQEGA